jgi:recombination protein RecA
MLDVACSIDVIEKSGAWFSFNGQRIGQGRENSKQFLKENPDIMKQVETKIKENKSAAFMKSASMEAAQDAEE